MLMALRKWSGDAKVIYKGGTVLVGASCLLRANTRQPHHLVLQSAGRREVPSAVQLANGTNRGKLTERFERKKRCEIGGRRGEGEAKAMVAVDRQ